MMRDCRGVNHMSPETRWVHARLEQWGEWARDIGQLSWPTRSITEKAGEGGILAGDPRPPIEMPEEVAVTDGAIGHLALIDRAVVKVYYLHWEPQEALWHRCRGIHSQRQFKNVLARARWRIRLYIEIFEDSFKP